MNDPQGTLRQAAILIASLDRDSADLMLSKLSPSQAATVRRAVVGLNEIDFEEQDDVITRFVHIRPTPDPFYASGIELDGTLGERVNQVETSTPNRSVSDRLAHDTNASERAPADHSPNDPKPFRFLHESQGQQLAPLLLGEHPQTIAVVLAHLPPERSAELLSAFTNQLQVDIVQRLVHLEQTDPAILRDIELEIESCLHGTIGGIGRRFAGFAAAATILRASDRQMQSQLLSDLSHHDAALARRLEGTTTPVPQPAAEPFRFDQLESFDENQLGQVLSMASNEVLVLALVGASPSMFDRAMKLVDAQEAQTLCQQMNQLGPTSLRDIEAAQNELARIATGLFRNSDERSSDENGTETLPPNSTTSNSTIQTSETRTSPTQTSETQSLETPSLETQSSPTRLSVSV